MVAYSQVSKSWIYKNYYESITSFRAKAIFVCANKKVVS